MLDCADVASPCIEHVVDSDEFAAGFGEFEFDLFALGFRECGAFSDEIQVAIGRRAARSLLSEASEVRDADLVERRGAPHDACRVAELAGALNGKVEVISDLLQSDNIFNPL